MLKSFEALCESLSILNAKPIHLKSCYWYQGRVTPLFNTTLRPNGNSCYNGNSLDHGTLSAGSRHGGRVNAVFVDGRVEHFINLIDAAQWRAMSSRAGHEITDTNW